MKTYRYWKRESIDISVHGSSQTIVCYGRSDSSEAEAAADARAKAAKVEQKLNGKKVPREDYSADIREETVRDIDAKNIITRNRYGALVWNSESVVIIDVDHHRKSIAELFGLKKADPKAAIVSDLEKVMARPENASLGLRIYETRKGVRAVLLGAYYDPLDKRAMDLLRQCHADRLYIQICRKQRCYRARLTPKPSRIEQKPIKYVWPMAPEESAQAAEWVKEYEFRSRGYAVCRFLKNVGAPAEIPPVVALHDETTKAFSELALA